MNEIEQLRKELEIESERAEHYRNAWQNAMAANKQLEKKLEKIKKLCKDSH